MYVTFYCLVAVFIKIKGVSEQKFKQFGEQFIKVIESILLSTESSEENEKDVKHDNTSTEQNQLEIF